MLNNITEIDLKLLSLYSKDYAAEYSILEMTKLLNINYSNAFRRVSLLLENQILKKTKKGHSNILSLNLLNIPTLQLMSYVDEIDGRKIKNAALHLLVQEALQLDPTASVGIFGSRVSGRATKESDWDIFVITQKNYVKEMEKIIAKVPHSQEMHLIALSKEEFEESLISGEETVVKHIIRNKQMIYNPHPFYNIIYKWEKLKHVPTQ